MLETTLKNTMSKTVQCAQCIQHGYFIFFRADCNTLPCPQANAMNEQCLQIKYKLIVWQME